MKKNSLISSYLNHGQYNNMDILYKPPMNFEAECKMLEKNFVTCLHEKSLHDIGVPMHCNVERVNNK